MTRRYCSLPSTIHNRTGTRLRLGQSGRRATEDGGWMAATTMHARHSLPAHTHCVASSRQGVQIYGDCALAVALIPGQPPYERGGWSGPCRGDDRPQLWCYLCATPIRPEDASLATLTRRGGAARPHSFPGFTL